MLRSLARACAAAVLAAGSTVALAAPAAAADCVTVDGQPVLCYGAATNVQTSNGVTVGPSVDVDVCVTTGPRLCDRGSETLTFGPAGLLLNGVTIAPAQAGGIPVHVPQVCHNSSPCVGPFDYTVPRVDIVCLTEGDPAVVVNDSFVLAQYWFPGTC